MKHPLSTLVLLGFVVSAAGAHPMNLDCGVLITHYVPELQFSEPPGEEMCEPNPCIPAGPAKGTSWGTIKGFYR